MNTKKATLSIATALIMANGVFAGDPVSDNKELDINSIIYIEEEIDFELGFDTADYLPEDFDPYKIYVDLNAIVYIEEDNGTSFDSKRNLPKGFHAYAYPQDVQSINYIDVNDFVELDFDTKKYLPEGFDAHGGHND